MKKKSGILFFLFAVVFSLVKSQDSLAHKKSPHQIGFDLFYLSVGDTIGDYYLKTTSFSNFKNEEWSSSSLGASFHYFYKMNFLSPGVRMGIMQTPTLYHTWDDNKSETGMTQDRSLVIHHSKFFISPSLKAENKFKWLTYGASAELPIMFGDKIIAQMDYTNAFYSSPSSATLLNSWKEEWKETIKSGISVGGGLGIHGSLMISKNIQMEISVNEYYFFINAKQKVQRDGTYESKNLQSGNYATTTGSFSQASDMNLRSGKFSKPSVRISFSYKF